MVEERLDVSGRLEQQLGQPAAVGSVDVLVRAAVEDRARLVKVSRRWLTDGEIAAVWSAVREPALRVGDC